MLNKKVSVLIRDIKKNNSLMYVKDKKMFNVIYPLSLKKNNNLKQHLLLRLFYINYFNYTFINYISNYFNMRLIDILNKSALDYFIESNNSDIEIFKYLLKYFEINDNIINKILKNKNSELCIYLIENKIIDINYKNGLDKGILDYFNFNHKIIDLVKYEYKLKLNIISNINNKDLLKFVRNSDIVNIFNNTESIEVKKYIIYNYDLYLDDNTILNIYKDVNMIKFLLNSNLNLKLLDEDGNNLLMIAVKNKVSFKYILNLVNRNIFDIKYINKNFRNILYFINEDDIIIFKYFIKLGVNPNIIDIDNENIIFNLCRNKYYNILKYVLSNSKIDLNLKNNKFNSAIFYSNNYEIIKLLLKYNINTYTTNINGQTFLNYYCNKYNCNFDILYLLICNGFDCNIPDYYSRTPLFYCLKYKNEISNLILIIKNTNNINQIDHEGNNALLYLIKNNKDIILVDLLIKNGINVNVKDNVDKNCLFYLLDEQFLNIIHLLVKYNINVNHTLLNGRTYLMKLCSIGLFTIIEYIINYINNINQLDINNNNALSYAIGLESEYSDLDIIKLLINYNCNYKIININGNSLLHIASSVYGYNIIDISILEYLLKLRIDKKKINKDGNNYLFYIPEEYLEIMLKKNIILKNDNDFIELVYTKNLKKFKQQKNYKMYFQIEDIECGICFEKIKKNNIFINCVNKHYFHKSCLLKWYMMSNKTKCPFCTIRLMANNTDFILI